MLPQQIIDALIARGWSAEIVEASTVNDLVPIDSGGLMKCVDGRPSDQPGMRGPKALGGIYAIASLRGVGTTAGLTEVVHEVTAVGYVPSVHGDEHSEAMGCGYFKASFRINLPASPVFMWVNLIIPVAVKSITF